MGQIMPAIPIIDVASLLTGDETGESAAAGAIGAACRDTGFFYITEHGVPAALIEDVFAASAGFFAAPQSVKRAAAFSGPGSNRGYIPLGGETLDPGRPADVKEAFNIGLELAADDPDLLAGKPFRAPNLWPDRAGFRMVMLEYFGRMWRLGRDLHRAFARDLGVDPLFFEGKFVKPMATLRLLHYPPSGDPIVSGQLGAGVHTDYGNVTILATDEVGGLMVRTRSGDWVDAPFVPGAFICNIGDCLMRWTNDIYVSTPHQVVSPRDRDRYSVAYFLDPDPGATVACIASCEAPDRPAKYAPVSAADFLKSRLEPTYVTK
jgi:isopenicillin N synthase-like dioxygenase